MSNRYVFSFGAGVAEGVTALGDDRRSVLGGKGAGLAEMTAAGLPVPPGFTISCQASLLFLEAGRLPAEAEAEIDEALGLLESRIGRRLGDPADPLLVSVRSGSPKSMPGMMDTILNLGLNPRTIEGLIARTRDRRFAYDAWRRFISSFASLVFGAGKNGFEAVLAKARAAVGAEYDHQLPAEVLEGTVVPQFLKLAQAAAGRPFPVDVREQLALARNTVFRSWNNARAVEYRRRFGIPDDLGTAVTIQTMVFGNSGHTSATGVGFTRNPATGEDAFFGEFLVNAQGEDVVAGIRTPQPISRMESALPQAYRELREHTARLERLYRWPQDFEFTVESGRLYILQTRDAKSTARAAIRWAIDFLDAGLLTERESLLRIDPSSLDQLLHPVFDPAALAKHTAAARGLAAGPGAATGEIALSAQRAAARRKEGARVVLVRQETSADDIAGMIAAEGVLTATGGMTSHAAVVGRQLGKTCVVGAGAIEVDEAHHRVRVGSRFIPEGAPISIDGTTGDVYFSAIPTVAAEVLRDSDGVAQSQVVRDYERLMGLADRHARLGVRANADKPADARMAVRLGARGIGLCRTEHMFFEPRRLPHVRRMILAAPQARSGLRALEALGLTATVARGRLALTGNNPARAKEIVAECGDAIREYLVALEHLLPLQRADFIGLLEAMAAFPVTIRTLDPPLHEFLPNREQLLVAANDLERGRQPKGWTQLAKTLRELVPRQGRGRKLSRLEQVRFLLRRVEDLHEFNPMMGHRGCRLGITYPEVTAMQARAIFEAAAHWLRQGIAVHPHVMIPLVGTVAELARQKAIVLETLRAVEAAEGISIPTQVGTMIEVPRAALTADEIAREADFFSFGTNDLTQMTYAYSRDDAGRFLREYIDSRILPKDPFVSIDAAGVGKLMGLAVAGGRSTRPALEVGICGEHGGDPDSIAICHRLGLDYVSCSPYRVPIARLAAAQVALRE